MSDWQMGEKSEKEHEKEHEKEQEKSWEEKHRRDPLSTVIWGAILIWAGVVLLLEQLGITLLSQQAGSWPLILAGVGVILLLEVGARLLIPSYRRPVLGTAFLGIVLVTLGLGWQWDLVFPLMLIAFGAMILVRIVLRRP